MQTTQWRVGASAGERERVRLAPLSLGFPSHGWAGTDGQEFEQWARNSG